MNFGNPYNFNLWRKSNIILKNLLNSLKHYESKLKGKQI